VQEFSGPLQCLSFGWVLRIIRYFLCNRIQVLGHRQGRLVPYRESKEFEKRGNAHHRQPTGVRDGEAYVSTWTDLRGMMFYLLTVNGGTMNVSLLKRAFREKFHVKLSDTAFGHASLYGLIRDSHLSDFVSLIVLANGNANINLLSMEARVQQPEDQKSRFLTFQKDVDQIYPGWKEKFGHTGNCSVRTSTFD